MTLGPWSLLLQPGEEKVWEKHLCLLITSHIPLTKTRHIVIPVCERGGETQPPAGCHLSVWKQEHICGRQPTVSDTLGNLSTQTCVLLGPLTHSQAPLSPSEGVAGGTQRSSELVCLS